MNSFQDVVQSIRDGANEVHLEFVPDSFDPNAWVSANIDMIVEELEKSKEIKKISFNVVFDAIEMIENPIIRILNAALTNRTGVSLKMTDEIIKNKNVMEVLAGFLETGTSIQSLTVASGRTMADGHTKYFIWGPTDFTRLAESLRINKSLKELVLDSVLFDVNLTGMDALTNAMSVNTNIVKLDIDSIEVVEYDEFGEERQSSLQRYGDLIYVDNMKQYAARNLVHAELTNIANIVTAGFTSRKQNSTKNFNLMDLSHLLIAADEKIRKLFSDKVIDESCYEMLMDRWMSLVVLFHRHAIDVGHFVTRIENVDARILMAEQCLAAMSNRGANSVYYKEACLELGNYYADCADVADNDEQRKAFMKTAFNFWKPCLDDNEFMSSLDASGLALRCALCLEALLPEAAFTVDSRFAKDGILAKDDLLSKEALDAVYNLPVANEKSLPGTPLPDFNILRSVQDTLSLSAMSHFVIEIDTLIKQLRHEYENIAEKNKSLLFGENYQSRIQFLSVLKDFIQGSLINKDEFLTQAKKLENSPEIKNLIDRGYPKLIVGRDVSSLQDFVAAFSEQKSQLTQAPKI